ncbi:hypothetical protein [Pseudooctadecabacter jejudonensis]|uniref:Uncharacterized protein n=1 Tax=Pseudooctadecabacter jejudonensis TaxID=1391910 RepID=A0A1Y5SNW4_9RHOB|nr:hypothetical protein [Pseudooctadecabacter jejudonensis]SLN44840.1 hypothetical protein PSJ8397_02333 [Pseudooctadecabacter jejudonensis]
MTTIDDTADTTPSNKGAIPFLIHTSAWAGAGYEVPQCDGTHFINLATFQTSDLHGLDARQIFIASDFEKPDIVSVVEKLSAIDYDGEIIVVCKATSTASSMQSLLRTAFAQQNIEILEVSTHNAPPPDRLKAYEAKTAPRMGSNKPNLTLYDIVETLQDCAAAVERVAYRLATIRETHVVSNLISFAAQTSKTAAEVIEDHK